MKQPLNEQFIRMQKLAGVLTENTNPALFKYFKKFVNNYFKNSDQDIDVSNTKSYEELMEMVDNYWDDEQTKDMLEAWIKDYFDHDQIGGMYRDFIELNMNS